MAATAIPTGVRWLYVKWLRPRITDELARQRLKLLWYVWGYWPLARLTRITPRARAALLWRFIRIDWRVLHAHTPREIAAICVTLASGGPAGPNEVVVEAGAWQGGSSTKLSLICRELGFKLWTYDSFSGVEPMSDDDRRESYDFSGAYSSPEAVLRANLQAYGDPGVCQIRVGWFRDTLAKGAVPVPVRLAYIDCDLAKGTREALTGIVPSLVDRGTIYSQDCHIDAVARVLAEPATWAPFGRGAPSMARVGRRLAAFTFAQAPARSRVSSPVTP